MGLIPAFWDLVPFAFSCPVLRILALPTGRVIVIAAVLAPWALGLLLLLLLRIIGIRFFRQHVEDAHGRLRRDLAPQLVAAADENLVELGWRADRMGGKRAAAPAGELRGGPGGGRDKAEGVGQGLLGGEERDRLVQLRAGGYGVADVERGVVGALNRGRDLLVQPERCLYGLETAVSRAALRVPVAAVGAAKSG